MGKKKKKNKNIVGISLGILLLIMTISFMTLLKILNIVPDKYFLMGSIVIGIVTLLIEMVLLIRKKSKVIKGIKIFAYIITFILLGLYSFMIYYLNKTMNFIDNISIIILLF